MNKNGKDAWKYEKIYNREVHFGKFNYKLEYLKEFEARIIEQCMDY